MIDMSMQGTSAGSQAIRPSRRWYLAAGCLLAVAAACVTFGVAGFLSLNQQIEDFQRVPAPGHGEITFTQPGSYVIYVETRGQCCGFSGGNQDSGPFANWSMRGELVSANGGAPVSVANWQGLEEGYSVAGHQGQTAAYFTITRPGSYVLATKDVTPRAITDLAVGRGIGRAVLTSVLLIAAGLVALLGAGLWFGLTALRRSRARRGLLQFPGDTGSMPWPSPGAAPGADVAGASRPVLVEFAGPARQHRGTVLLRAILAIPLVICYHFVRYAAWLVLATGWFAALFTGRLPGYAAEFLTWYQQWEIRMYAYLLLLTDKYPATGSQHTYYPVSVVIRPGRLNRGAVLFRVILIIPAWLVGELLAYGLGLIMIFVTWLMVVLLGRMPQPLYEAIAAIVRYWARIKAYWYLLTDVYPASLFGDRPGPAPGWPGPSQPALLPADYVAPPAPLAAFPALDWEPPAPVAASPAPDWKPPQPVAASPDPGGAPRPLILSRAAKRLVGLTLGIGAVAPIALLALMFGMFMRAASTSPAPSAVAPAAPITTEPTPPASTAPIPISTVPPPAPGRADRWLYGLSSLSTDMENAMGPGEAVVTATSLRSAASHLRRCPAELAALGPPTAQLRQVYRMAARACGAFERGAACYAAAAKGYDAATVSPDPKRFNRLLDCGDAGFNRGSNLITTAAADGSFIQQPG
jgi:Domain of unknown function (DUF4389)